MISVGYGTTLSPANCSFAMTEYRFITPARKGKWYPDLKAAQLRANAIGAGFLGPDGQFVPYRGTVLEMR